MCRGPVALWDPLMLAPLLVAGARWAALGADRLVLLIAVVGPAPSPYYFYCNAHCTRSCPRHNAEKTTLGQVPPFS
jgi:hypothetical protein